MKELWLEDANQNKVNIDDGIKYMILEVSGLNPPSASLFTSKSPNRKGSKYNGSTLDERNIVVTIKILGDVEVNRNALYQWIDTEQYIKILYRNDVKNVYCEGHVVDCEIDMFSSNEIIKLAITCENPYWKDLQEINKEITSVLKQFTFPFAISEPIPFSSLLSSNTTSIFNSGAETGLKITIKCLEDVNKLVVYNPNNTSERFELNTTLLKDWVVVIDTDNSPKTVKAYKPDGSVENLLKYTNNNITWFMLKKGINWLGYTSDTDLSNLEIRVSFVNKYLGV